MRLLDLFCGRWGWSRAFAARGWVCVGVDLTHPPEVPMNCIFVQWDILDFENRLEASNFDFIVASSPCEQFSVHGMKHFHPNPPYPELGIKLFNHTRQLCEASGVPYVMENVRAAQQFVGNAVHHCGPFYLWGNAVPPLMHRGIEKGNWMGCSSRVKGLTPEQKKAYRQTFPNSNAASRAVIPPELANCVADYAENLLEQKRSA